MVTAGNRAGLCAARVRDVHGWYGESPVRNGMTFDSTPARSVTPAGPQRRRQHYHHAVIMGMSGHRKGSIVRLRPRAHSSQVEPHCRARAIGYCPESAHLSSLNVGRTELPPKVRSAGFSDREHLQAVFQSAGAIDQPGPKLSAAISNAGDRATAHRANSCCLSEPPKVLPLIVQRSAITMPLLRQQGFTILDW